MWIIMKLAWVPIAGILLIALVHVVTSESTANDEAEENVAEAPEQLTNEDIKEESELPILPPLILLDFINGTNTSTSDEKTKRTVNDNFGYGFQSNNFFSGKKVNYYFPSGKSGTTVSIEESISPFLPRTIIERSKPVAEKPESSTKNPAKNFNSRDQQYTDVHSSFGLKMKSSRDFSRFTTTTQSTIKTNTQKSTYTSTPAPVYSGFYTQKPLFQSNSFSSGSYTTKKTQLGRTTTAPYVGTTFNPPLDTTFNRYSQNVESSTLNPIVSEQFYQPVKVLPPVSHSSLSNEKTVHPTSLSNYPKYTIENGVKYEHKIVWKYPDGRVSDDPPNSYVNSYSEYETAPRTTSYSISSDSAASSKDQSVYNQHTNLRYQGPLQFPKDSEVNVQQPTSFTKPITQGNIQNPKNYPYVRNSQTSKYSLPKLEVGTPNPEYLPPPDNDSSRDQDVTSAGQSSLDTLSPYSKETRKLLNKVLSPPKESYDIDDSETYTNNHYTNLLNYNPSISQYIKNPASILNAQPTFIQAGNSLIPVIILRVDGAPPVQPKPSPNINLKALLQQYISQYANNVNDLSRGSNYEFEDEELVNRYQDPHYDLKKLTETLKQFSQHSTSPRPRVGDSVTDSYGNVLGVEYKSLAESRRNSEYRHSYKKPQKIKSVQIVEDPRFHNYKESN